MTYDDWKAHDRADDAPTDDAPVVAVCRYCGAEWDPDADGAECPVCGDDDHE